MKKLLLTMVAILTATASFSQNYTHYLNNACSDDKLETKDFYYDNEYRLIADYWQDLREGGMTLRDTLTYDENGNVIKLSAYQWYENSYWLYANYIDYGYNALNQRISRDNYNNFGGTFEHGGTYNYEYDENGNQVYYEMIFGSFGLFEKCERTFDENNNCILELGYQSDFAGGFDPSWKIEYTYNSDGFMTVLKSYYYEYGSWSINAHVVYNRDENNNITLQESFTPSGAVAQRYEYEYDTNILSSEVANFVNPENEWPSFEKTTNAITKYSFWTQDMNGVLQYICDYFFYYNEIEHTSVEENISENVSIYPNPVEGIMTIETNDYQKVSIYDIMGRCVMESEVNGILNIDMSNVAKGIYFVKLIGKSTSELKKFVVK